MSHDEPSFSKTRLEAFSDGVIAVVITIMVLDLKAPESATLEALLRLWPSFLSYLISFIFGAIYWINHHNLIVLARRITPAVIWANNLLLFALSLFPFATAFMAASHISPIATMLYGAVQLACALSFNLLEHLIGAQHADDAAFHEWARARRPKNLASTALYALAIPIAWFAPWMAIAIFATISTIWVTPGILTRRIG